MAGLTALSTLVKEQMSGIAAEVTSPGSKTKPGIRPTTTPSTKGSVLRGPVVSPLAAPLVQGIGLILGGFFAIAKANGFSRPGTTPHYEYQGLGGAEVRHHQAEHP